MIIWINLSCRIAKSALSEEIVGEIIKIIHTRRMMMKIVFFIIKTIWQIILYVIELLSISFLLAYLTTLIQKCNSVWSLIERVLLCYTFYQIIVVIILNNINDIEKDSCLAYMTNIKKVLLYKETKSKYIKEDILKNINYQLDSGTINNKQYREAYIILKKEIENINNIDKSYIEMELINAEHKYEAASLNWKYSFLLRLFK